MVIDISGTLTTKPVPTNYNKINLSGRNLLTNTTGDNDNAAQTAVEFGLGWMIDSPQSLFVDKPTERDYGIYKTVITPFTDKPWYDKIFTGIDIASTASFVGGLGILATSPFLGGTTIPLGASMVGAGLSTTLARKLAQQSLKATSKRFASDLSKIAGVAEDIAKTTDIKTITNALSKFDTFNIRPSEGSLNLAEVYAKRFVESSDTKMVARQLEDILHTTNAANDAAVTERLQALSDVTKAETSRAEILQQSEETARKSSIFRILDSALKKEPRVAGAKNAAELSSRAVRTFVNSEDYAPRLFSGDTQSRVKGIRSLMKELSIIPADTAETARVLKEAITIKTPDELADFLIKTSGKTPMSKRFIAGKLYSNPATQTKLFNRTQKASQIKNTKLKNIISSNVTRETVGETLQAQRALDANVAEEVRLGEWLDTLHYKGEARRQAADLLAGIDSRSKLALRLNYLKYLPNKTKSKYTEMLRKSMSERDFPKMRASLEEDLIKNLEAGFKSIGKVELKSMTADIEKTILKQFSSAFKSANTALLVAAKRNLVKYAKTRYLDDVPDHILVALGNVKDQKGAERMLTRVNEESQIDNLKFLSRKLGEEKKMNVSLMKDFVKTQQRVLSKLNTSLKKSSNIPAAQAKQLRDSLKAFVSEHKGKPKNVYEYSKKLDDFIKTFVNVASEANEVELIRQTEELLTNVRVQLIENNPILKAHYSKQPTEGWLSSVVAKMGLANMTLMSNGNMHYLMDGVVDEHNGILRSLFYEPKARASGIALRKTEEYTAGLRAIVRDGKLVDDDFNKVGDYAHLKSDENSIRWLNDRDNRVKVVAEFPELFKGVKATDRVGYVKVLADNFDTIRLRFLDKARSAVSKDAMRMSDWMDDFSRLYGDITESNSLLYGDGSFLKRENYFPVVYSDFDTSKRLNKLDVESALAGHISRVGVDQPKQMSPSFIKKMAADVSDEFRLKRNAREIMEAHIDRVVYYNEMLPVLKREAALLNKLEKSPTNPLPSDIIGLLRDDMNKLAQRGRTALSQNTGINKFFLWLADRAPYSVLGFKLSTAVAQLTVLPEVASTFGTPARGVRFFAEVSQYTHSKQWDSGVWYDAAGESRGIQDFLDTIPEFASRRSAATRGGGTAAIMRTADQTGSARYVERSMLGRGYETLGDASFIPLRWVDFKLYQHSFLAAYLHQAEKLGFMPKDRTASLFTPPAVLRQQGDEVMARQVEEIMQRASKQISDGAGSLNIANKSLLLSRGQLGTIGKNGELYAMSQLVNLFQTFVMNAYSRMVKQGIVEPSRLWKTGRQREAVAQMATTFIWEVIAKNMYVNGATASYAAVNQTFGGPGVQTSDQSKAKALGREFLSNAPLVGPIAGMLAQHDRTGAPVLPSPLGGALQIMTDLADAGEIFRANGSIDVDRIITASGNAATVVGVPGARQASQIIKAMRDNNDPYAASISRFEAQETRRKKEESDAVLTAFASGDTQKGEELLAEVCLQGAQRCSSMKKKIALSKYSSEEQELAGTMLYTWSVAQRVDYLKKRLPTLTKEEASNLQNLIEDAGLLKGAVRREFFLNNAN